MTARDSVLVGDVGGTHARFAVVEVSSKSFEVHHRLDLESDKFPSFDDALRAYLDRAGLSERPEAAALAVAGPVTNGQVKFTNRGWQASEDGLRKLGFRFERNVRLDTDGDELELYAIGKDAPVGQ